MENQLAEDPSLRKHLDRQGRGVLSDGRAMTTEQLLELLHTLGIEMDRAKFERLAHQCSSAEEMSRNLPQTKDLGNKQDWVWIALTCLWERWLPERASPEMIDDKMQAGYDALHGDSDAIQACRIWLETWLDIVRVMDKKQFRSFAQFDKWFGGFNSLYNWIQDFEMELSNAGLDDPQFFHERISLCQTVLERFPHEDELVIDNFKRALAESYFAIGDPREGDRLFSQWLEEDPQWGWGWIGWSDMYFVFSMKGIKDASKAESLLKKGLVESPDVEEREILLERLEHIYTETGREDEAQAIREEMEKAKPVGRADRGVKTGAKASRAMDHGDSLPIEESNRPAQSIPAMTRWGDSSAPEDAQKRRVGRNDPCPCGSGKKFKKCCGRR
jgi:tetratricopeptide (TPR) repeat protein